MENLSQLLEFSTVVYLFRNSYWVGGNIFDLIPVLLTKAAFFLISSVSSLDMTKAKVIPTFWHCCNRQKGHNCLVFALTGQVPSVY